MAFNQDWFRAFGIGQPAPAPEHLPLPGTSPMPSWMDDLVYRGGPGPLNPQPLPYFPSSDLDLGSLITPLKTPSLPNIFQSVGAMFPLYNDLAKPGLDPSRYMKARQRRGLPVPGQQRADGSHYGPSTGGEIWDVIDQEAGDPRVAMAMKLAVQMESGGRADAVGDNGQSHGFYQIYQGAHAGKITPEQSRDPVASTRYMLGEFRSAVQRVPPAMWESNPQQAAALAAYYAERPQVMYPQERVASAYRAISQPRRQPARPNGQGWDHIVPGGSGRVERGGTHGGYPAVDIFAPAGTPIYAPTDGESSPATLSLGGNATTLQGADGRWYYFAHAQRPMVGGRVRKGQIIGYVGNTGNAKNTPSHLHYAVATNPNAFAQRNGSGDIDPY